MTAYPASEREELGELRASLRRALAAPQPAPAADDQRRWRTTWSALTGIGLTAFCVPSERGGFGDDVAAALLSSRELGAALHPSPYPALVAAAYALSRGPESPQISQLLDDVLAGDHVATLAFLERSSTVDTERGVARVHGIARLVLGAPDADSYVVVAPDQSSLVLVERDKLTSFPTVHEFDVTRSCADVAFTGTTGRQITADAVVIDHMQLVFGLLLSADAIGGVQYMLDRTIAYAGERVAFGKPIGAFQAVQHRLVDHTLRVRGMALVASRAADLLHRNGSCAEREVLQAELTVSRYAVHVLHDLLQLTGAIGFTWEHGLHLHERRAHLDARLRGNPRHAAMQLFEHHIRKRPG